MIGEKSEKSQGISKVREKSGNVKEKSVNCFLIVAGRPENRILIQF